MTSDARDLADDPHLNEIGYFAEFDHPVIGTYKDIAAPVYLNETPGVMYSSAPLLGQHTAEILHSVGLGEQESQAGQMDNLRVSGQAIQTPPVE